MAPDKDIKLNFDTPPEEETISPDKNCSICYGKGTVLVSINRIPSPYSPHSSLSFRPDSYDEKECPCITRQRVELTASKSLSNIFKNR